MVALYNTRKSRVEIIREYDLSSTSFDIWIQRITQTGSSKEKDNRTPEQEEPLHLQKENLKLKIMVWFVLDNCCYQ
jgi:Transposase.